MKDYVRFVPKYSEHWWKIKDVKKHRKMYEKKYLGGGLYCMNLSKREEDFF